MLDETRTTMTCAGCGSVLQDVPGTDGRPLRGIKECRGCCKHKAATERAHWHCLQEAPLAEDGVPTCKHCCGGLEDIHDGGKESKLKSCKVQDCTEKHTSRLLNRDTNASKNLMLVLRSLLSGEPRPAHLCKQARPPPLVVAAAA